VKANLVDPVAEKLAPFLKVIGSELPRALAVLDI